MSTTSAGKETKENKKRKDPPPPPRPRLPTKKNFDKQKPIALDENKRPYYDFKMKPKGIVHEIEKLHANGGDTSKSKNNFLPFYVVLSKGQVMPKVESTVRLNMNDGKSNANVASSSDEDSNSDNEEKKEEKKNEKKKNITEDVVICSTSEGKYPTNRKVGWVIVSVKENSLFL